MLIRHPLATIAAVAIAAGCSSVPDVTFVDSDADAAMPQPQPQPDGGPPVDAGMDGLVEPSCKPTGVEVCDDGVDNDCNGRVDCADPACTADYECVEGPPPGWTLVALADAVRAACPAGYASPVDVEVITGNGSYACNCTCSGEGGTLTCTAGTLAVTVGTDVTCTTSSDTATFPTNAANCTGTAGATEITLPAAPHAKLTAPTGPATCAANVSSTATPKTAGRTCAPPAKDGKGCRGNQRCLPKPAGYNLCVAKTGDSACPPTFTKQRRVGSTIDDTRMCGADCTCGPPTACASSVTLYSTPNCTGGKNTVVSSAAHGTCGALSDGAFDAKAFRSQTTGGCGAPTTPATKQGGLSFVDEQTVCCK